MALGAFTTATSYSFGNARLSSQLFKADSSYPSGGYSITPAMFGMNQIIAVLCRATPESGGRLMRYDSATQKILIFTALGTEAAGASNQSAVFPAVHVIGR